MRSCERRYGKGRSNAALTVLKIAVVAAMPSASVISTTAVKPGDPRRLRTASRRSCDAD
jgi:hypothetical protein